MKKDKITGFQYDFTPRELFYFLFKKKICPNCGSKMIKEKTYEIVSSSELNTRSDPLFIQDTNVKHYYYKFKCSSCNQEFLLKDLAQKKTK